MASVALGLEIGIKPVLGGAGPAPARPSLGLLLSREPEDAPGILQRGEGEGERPPPSLAALQQPPSRREQSVQQKS